MGAPVLAALSLVVAIVGTPATAGGAVGPPALVITEVMTNPSAVPDEDGEWFEVHNPADQPVDLTGWVVTDEREDRFVFGAGTVPAGGHAVVGRSDDVGANGGAVSIATYGDAVRLTNGPDRLVLLRPDGSEADRVDWGEPGFPWPRGRSMSLRDVAIDNASPDAWCLSTTSMWGGDLGTPGSANRCDRSHVALRISEVLANPGLSDDHDGEWFEVHNEGDTPIDLLGFTVKDDDHDRLRITGSHVVAPGGRAVLGRTADQERNGGVEVDVVYGDAVTLHNRADEVVLLDPTGTEVDRVAWPGDQPLADHNGAAMVAGPAGWCRATTVFGIGDLGTPGRAGGCEARPGPIAPLVITEVMADPAAVSDDDGEWFEVHNPTDRPVDLLGWRVSDHDGDLHRVDVSVEVPAGGYLVLGRSADRAANGGVPVAHAYGTDVRLSNGADELVLADPAGTPVDRIVWDDDWPRPVGSSISLVNATIDRSLSGPQAIGNEPWGWCESAITFGFGDRGTPGAPTICLP
ncbi:MAG: lamin tail domain-containing protein [Acidimicrobiia bacterium]